jgi:hypothetical protein
MAAAVRFRHARPASRIARQRHHSSSSFARIWAGRYRTAALARGGNSKIDQSAAPGMASASPSHEYGQHAARAPLLRALQPLHVQGGETAAMIAHAAPEEKGPISDCVPVLLAARGESEDQLIQLPPSTL